jgi:hypothetical protein
MATQTLKRCPKSTCIANGGFQQMLFTGFGTHCPHCGSKLELVAPARNRSVNKGGSKSGGKSVGGKTVSRASSGHTIGNKKRRRKVAQKKMQFKTWDLFLKPEPRKSTPRKDVGRKRVSK